MSSGAPATVMMNEVDREKRGIIRLPGMRSFLLLFHCGRSRVFSQNYLAVGFHRQIPEPTPANRKICTTIAVHAVIKLLISAHVLFSSLAHLFNFEVGTSIIRGVCGVET